MNLLLVLHLIFWASYWVRAEYTAAVVEFYPEQNRSLEPEERLRRNVDGYLKLLKEISQDKVPDIVVFPEATLATNAIIVHHEDYIPYSVEVTVNQSLCPTEDETFLTRLACAARSYKTYLVVNICEKARSNTTQDGWDYYNTNVVLDRSGTVISRYRKYNLFGEIFMNVTATPDISIFDTDFGVTFGTFICFDVLFRTPTLELIRKYNVTHIVYPTMWFSELPFLTALQAQQQWAYAVNATFLASGANDPERGSGGTGIFQGSDGVVVFDMLGNTESKAFVAKVPGKNFAVDEDVGDIDIKARQMDGFFFKTDNLEPYTSKIIQFGTEEINDTVCHDAFCCNFQISLEWETKFEQDKSSYVYHMLAFDGVRSFSGVYNGGVEICGVVACMNQNTESCGTRFPNYDYVSWPVTFKRIQIDAKFAIDDNRIQFPNSLLSNIKPILPDSIEWTSTTSSSKIERTYVLKKPQQRLMTFAIYGRVFLRDSEP